MRVFSEDPATWHIRIKELEDVEARRAAYEAGKNKPDPPPTAAELIAELSRLTIVSANECALKGLEQSYIATRRFSALWLLEHKAMPGQLSDWYELDSKKAGHPGRVGFRAGEAIQNAILWREHGWNDGDHALLRLPWSAADLVPPGLMDKLPLILMLFWIGLEFGAEKARETCEKHLADFKARHG